mgnify:CR=1 FL=1
MVDGAIKELDNKLALLDKAVNSCNALIFELKGYQTRVGKLRGES